MSNISLNYAQIIDPVSFKSINLAKIYIGEYGTLPNPANAATWKQAYFVNSDGSRTSASQPIRTNAAGYAVDGSGNIKTIQVDGGYSLLVQDQLSVTKFSQACSPENDGVVLEFDTIAGFTGAPDGAAIFFRGRDAVGDGGGGNLRFLAGSTAPADGGTVYAVSGGRLVREGWSVFGVNVDWFGAKADGSDDAMYFAAAFAAHKDVKTTAGKVYTIASFVGIPDQTLYVATPYRLTGGGTLNITATQAPFTCKSYADNTSLTTNVFVGKMFVTGLNFIGPAVDGIFDCDHIYNLIFTRNHVDGVGKVFSSRRAKTGYSEGYIQSLTVKDNIFSKVSTLVSAKRAFNFTFVDNMCEACLAGIYIDGLGDPAVNSLRAENNLWEGGGVFLKLGAVLGYSISGNYFEKNSLGDVPTLKCIIHMVRTTGGFSSGGSIKNNAVQVDSQYVTDVDYRDVKFSGTTQQVQSLNVAQPIVEGNWTNSYQFITEEQIFNQLGNGTSTVGGLARWNSPKLHTEARVSYDVNARAFDAATHLSAGVFNVWELSTAKLKTLSAMNKRPMAAELTLFMQQKTAGEVVVGACVAKILLVVQAAEGSSAGSASPSVYVGASLMSFAEIPAGSVFDTAFGSDFKKHFTNPVLTIVANGADNYYLRLSGYAAPATANYGAANKILTHATFEMFGKNNSSAIAGQLGSA